MPTPASTALRLLLLAAGAALLLVAAPSPALAYGPALHVREARIVLDALAARDPAWAELAATPDAGAWLSLGAISPDIQLLSDALSFGHQKPLSYHLFDLSADLPPRFRLFALGHLVHLLSDGAESFLGPTLIAGTDLGLVHLQSGSETNRADTETLTEAYGDLVLGDWDPIIELLFFFYLDGAEATARLDEGFGWYCQAGAALLDRPTDCDAALADLRGKLDAADSLLGGLTRQTARSILDSLLDQPLEALLALFDNGALGFLLGSADSPTPYRGRELARVARSPLVDRAYWQRWDTDGFSRLAASWVQPHLDTRPDGWPAWNGNAYIAGNIESVMHNLPAHYDVHPGFIVDDVVWRDADDAPLAAATPAHDGQPASVTLRFFTTTPFAGEVHAVVRKDHPGLNVDHDEVLGEATATVNLDPTAWTTTPRPTLTVPFTIDLADALGFTLDVTLDDAHGPTFTTSWDRLWTIQTLELDRPIYRHFGTYGHWPPSLPAAEPPVVDTGAVFVKVRVAPAGDGVPGALVQLDAAAPTPTPANGIVLTDGLPSGPHTITVTADGYAPTEPWTVEVAAGAQTWAAFALYPIPTPEAPAWVTPDCFDLTWDAARFHGQPRTFMAAAHDAQDALVPLTPTALGRGGRAALCFDAPPTDGALLTVDLWAVYTDADVDHDGPHARTAPIGVDGSAPVLDTLRVEQDTASACAGGSPGTLTAIVLEPHSPVIRATITEDGAPLDADLSHDPASGAWTTTLAIPPGADVPRTFGLEVENAAHGVTAASITLGPLDPSACEADVGVEPEPDADEPDAGLVDAAPSTPVATKAEGCGCQTPTAAAPPVGALALLAAAAVVRVVRRR